MILLRIYSKISEMLYVKVQDVSKGIPLDVFQSFDFIPDVAFHIYNQRVQFYLTKTLL